MKEKAITVIFFFKQEKNLAEKLSSGQQNQGITSHCKAKENKEQGVVLDSHLDN